MRFKNFLKAKKWTLTKYRNFTSKLKRDAQSDIPGGMSDDMAFETARNILRDDPSLEKFMRTQMGVSDVVGRLASDI